MQAEEHQHLHIAPEDIRAPVVVEVDEGQPGEAQDRHGEQRARRRQQPGNTIAL